MLTQALTQTVVLYLHKARSSDKQGYIYMRVKIPGKDRYVPKSLGYKIPEEFWDAEGEKILPGFPEYDIINDDINTAKLKFKNDLRQVMNESQPLTEQILQKVIGSRATGGSFIKFFKTHIEYLDGKASPGYVKHWKVELNRLTAYAGEMVSFLDITTEFIEGYEMDARKTLNPNTTLNTCFKKLDELIRKAIDRGHIQPQQIAGYKWPGYKKPPRNYLTLDETEEIWKKLQSGDLDLLMEKIAAFFLVECYSGIRFTDWSRFKVERLIDDDNFKVRAQKNGEPVYLPLKHFPRLKRILEYIERKGIIFDEVEQVTNRLLKILGIDLKFEIKLTTHVGRHTCATLLGEMGYGAKDIAQVLGISEQTAKVYIQHTRQGLKNTAERFGGL